MAFKPSRKRDLVLYTNLSRLRGYLTRGAASTVNRRPSDEDCYFAFLDWVSRLKCPNYNCRQEGFKSLESFSDHVSDCTYLLETDYWCSFCCQVEHLGVEECRGGSFVVKNSNRDSRLRRAGHFLKRISCVHCRNPLKRFHRRNSGVMANNTELGANAPYPHGKAEMATHRHAGLIPDTSSTEEIPQYPNHPDDYRYAIELESPHPITPNPAAIRSSRSLGSTDGNRRFSEIPTVLEKKASTFTHTSASSLTTPRGRTTSSSHENAKSQRNSRFGLRVSTTSSPLDNTPSAYTFEQFPASDPKTSNFSIDSRNVPGSSIGEPSNLVSPGRIPHMPVIVGQYPQDHSVISPISPEWVQPGSQISQNLVSSMTYSTSGPDNVQEDRARPRGDMILPHSASNDCARSLKSKQILDTMMEPTIENSSILTEDFEKHVRPEYVEVPRVYRKRAREEPELEDPAPSHGPWPKGQDLQTTSQQEKVPITPKTHRNVTTVIDQSPSPESQIGQDKAIVKNFQSALAQALPIQNVDLSQRVAVQCGQRSIEAPIPSTQALVKHVHQVMRQVKDQWEESSGKWPDIGILLAGLNTSFRLNDGLEEFQQCLSGKPPTTFEGVFALVQFAYACASTSHYEDNHLAWSAFYQNTRQWGKAITDWQDRYRFSKITHLLWQVNPQIIAIDYNVCDYDQQSPYMSGAIINSCVRFLASESQLKKPTSKLIPVNLAFEYADILERTGNAPDGVDALQIPKEKISLLLEQMIKPLLQHNDFAPFSPLIGKARHLLSSGHLRNARDVEVMLLSRCHVSAISVYHLRSNPLTEHRNIVNHKIYLRSILRKSLL